MTGTTDTWIRTATEQDAPAIASLDNLFDFRSTDFDAYLAPRKVLRAITYLMGTGDQIIARIDSIISEVDNSAYLMRLAVHPSFRRRGYARHLVEYAMAEAARRGVRSIELHVSDTNAPAMALYNTLGFSVKHHDIHMCLNLSSEGDNCGGH